MFRISKTRLSLNILRIFSIISLLLVISSSISVSYFAWPSLGQANTIFQFINRILISLVAIILILAEIEWPQRALVRVFPMLGEQHSWAVMGWIQGVFGGAKLKERRRRDPPSDHADPAMTPHFPPPPRSTYKDVETASTHSTMRMGGRRDSYYTTTASVYSPDAVIAHY
ncbi:hypothetical protein HK104_004854 [Borealophlyctis nickersoniae]|nr:hypothetical protein HK104_004854 [Borealophlyctis nickersoniae]